MKKDAILKKIMEGAKKDGQNRQDPRYLQTMGFLVAKGFLKINRPIALLPNKRLRLTDAIWAGENVEPRILEVLPAAILRLPKHFDLDAKGHPELFALVEKLKKQEGQGDSLWGISFEKFKVWVGLPMVDKRMKGITEKRVTKTFRLRPEVVQRLRKLSKDKECSETEALEQAVLK